MRWNTLLKSLLILLVLAAVAACSDSSNPVDPAPDPDPDPGKADVNTALNALPAWQQVSPPVTESRDGRIGDQSGDGSFLADSDARYKPAAVCVATPHELSKNPREIITLSTDQGILVPGILVQGRSHVLGSLSQLRIDGRAPVDLVIDEAAATVPSRTVDVPGLATLRTGVNSLIQDAETSGFEGSSSVVYEKVTSYSAEQAALALNFSARYLGTTASGSLRSRTSGSETTVTASFVQRAFTITADAPPFPEDWFTDDLTEERLARYVSSGQIGEDNPPLYVQSVTYGRIVMVNFTSSASREEITGLFEAGYDNGVGSLDGRISARQEQILREASIEVVSLGGPAEGGFGFANEILKPNDPEAIGLDGFFAGDVPLTSFVPISYVLADLRTDQVAYVGETSRHEVLDCAGRAESTFEGGLEGWAGVDMESGYPFHSSSSAQARSGSGYVVAFDGTTGTSYLRAPAMYRGDKEVYLGGRITYWTRVWCSNPAAFGTWSFNPDCSDETWGTISSVSSPAVIIEGVDSQKTLVGRFISDAFVPDTWQQRTVSLAPGEIHVYNASLGEDVGDAVPATADDIREVLANISRLQIRAEFAGGEKDYVLMDDVRMDPPAVPVNQGLFTGPAAPPGQASGPGMAAGSGPCVRAAVTRAGESATAPRATASHGSWAGAGSPIPRG